ncbi:hypothetical protein IB265_33345 [Ensifer sp. ENS10]|uniref:hypothetical protein n=1 Tax=Ensifer sp. ENS10 TaxID=2769286 RepID=UPI00177E4B4A|nr:hypothetical protein [Ensifer sp. ENS10]MBD9511643.1 hypothetical protein [Ensifer sp. ENS10]
MKLSVTKDLEPLKQQALSNIDANAEKIRGRYITLGSGQAMVYDQKRAEAEKFMVDYNVDLTTPPSEIPHLTAESAMNGISLFDQAVIYLTMRQSWLTVSLIIEERRLVAKTAVMAAQSPAQIEQAADVDWSDLPAP